MSTYSTGDYEYRVASRADEPAVRGLLARVATRGRIQLSLCREPDAFGADFDSVAHSYILARNVRSGERFNPFGEVAGFLSVP